MYEFAYLHMCIYVYAYSVNKLELTPQEFENNAYKE